MKNNSGDMIMTKEGVRNSLSVLQHRELDRGTLGKLIGQAGLTVEEFVELLR